MIETLTAFLELGGFAVCLVIAGSGLRLFAVVWHMRRSTYVREQSRLPDQPVPDELLPIEAELLGLGFTPSRHMQGRLALHKKPFLTWSYIHRDGQIEASLTPTATRPPFLLAFETAFPDHSALVTWYPRGQNIDAPHFLGRFAQHSVHNAFDHHLFTQIQQSDTHGEPLQVPLDDTAYLSAADEFNTHHSRVMFARAIPTYIGQAVVRLGIALFAASIILSLRSNVPALAYDMSQLTLVPMLMLFSALLMVAGIGFSRRGKAPVAVDADRTPPVDPGIHPLNRPDRIT